MKPRFHTSLSGNRGFNLLEVLIALVVLAVGLLGLAALQNFSLKFNTQSYQRTQATMLIYEMIDRMRANPRGLAQANYLLDPATNVVPAAPTCIGTGASCSSADMAAYDIAEWMRAMQQRAVLVKPRARIAPTAGGPVPLIEVSITWSENEFDVTQSVSVALQ